MKEAWIDISTTNKEHPLVQIRISVLPGLQDAVFYSSQTLTKGVNA